MIKIRAYIVTIALTVAATVLPAALKAQQEPLIGQYMFNPYLINPAFAGAEGNTYFTFTASNQWAGYAKGPQTYIVAGQSRIRSDFFRAYGGRKSRYRKASGNTGVGAMIFSDWNGNVARNGFQATYAYHTELRGNDQLSLGVSFSMFQFRANVTSDDLPDQSGGDEVLLQGKRVSQISPEANFGVYYTKDNFFGGLSVSNLFESKIRFAVDDKNASPEVKRHYYLMGGYKLKASYYFDLEPSAIFTVTEKGQFNADINFKAYYKSNYWAGLSYRTTGAALVLLGADYQQFKFGYAFNFGFGSVSALSRMGSHEFMLGYSIGDKTKRYRWIRRY